MSDSPSTPTNEIDPPAVRPRPRWLRALGHDDPPARFDAAGHAWRRIHIYKHDAFAATALYARVDDATQKAVGKFSRRQSAFGLPFAWLGQRFHDREQEVYRRMQGQPGVPATLGEVRVAGQIWPAAGAHHYVKGHPLKAGERPHDDFFPALERLIQAFHHRGVAVVDLNKRDNILVGDDGEPHLIDFQISLAANSGPGAWVDPRAWWLPSAMRADQYHLMKNWRRHRPDQLTAEQLDLDRYRPVSIRLWRTFIRPIHAARRKLFVTIGIRTGKGDPASEVAPDVRPGSGDAIQTQTLIPTKPTSPKLPA